MSQITQLLRIFSLPGILVGGVTGILLLLPARPWWLVLALIVVLLAVIWWQRPLITAQLHNTTHGDGGTKAVSWVYWRWRLVGLLTVIVAALWGYGHWWVQGVSYPFYTLTINNTTNQIVSQKTDKTGTLPNNYAWRRLLWEAGWQPLPELVTIPAGKFSMGSEKGQESEKPVHDVTIPNSFSMTQHEITFEQYDYYVWRMQQEGVETEFLHDESWGRSDRPAINISWKEAQAYAYWLSNQLSSQQECRLPSEAEWEYAAQAGAQTDYFWGDEVGKNRANCADCGSQWDGKQTAPTGSFPPNKLGLNDMHGNVWEWMQDCWRDNYKDAPVDGSAHEFAECPTRVLRGGSWGNAAGSVRSAVRDDFIPDGRYDSLGFRVLCSPH